MRSSIENIPRAAAIPVKVAKIVLDADLMSVGRIRLAPRQARSATRTPRCEIIKVRRSGVASAIARPRPSSAGSGATSAAAGFAASRRAEARTARRVLTIAETLRSGSPGLLLQATGRPALAEPTRCICRRSSMFVAFPTLHRK
jgi:hypothetical protein